MQTLPSTCFDFSAPARGIGGNSPEKGIRPSKGEKSVFADLTGLMGGSIRPQFVDVGNAESVLQVKSGQRPILHDGIIAKRSLLTVDARSDVAVNGTGKADGLREGTKGVGLKNRVASSFVGINPESGIGASDEKIVVVGTSVKGDPESQGRSEGLKNILSRSTVQVPNPRMNGSATLAVKDVNSVSGDESPHSSKSVSTGKTDDGVNVSTVDSRAEKLSGEAAPRILETRAFGGSRKPIGPTNGNSNTVQGRDREFQSNPFATGTTDEIVEPTERLVSLASDRWNAMSYQTSSDSLSGRIAKGKTVKRASVVGVSAGFGRYEAGPTTAVSVSEAPAGTSPAPKVPVFDQMIASIRTMIKAGESRVTLSLRPRELGRMRIEILSGKDATGARIFVETEEVKSMIRMNLPELRSILEREGVHVDDVSVDVSDEFSASSHPWADSHRADRSGTAGRPAPEQTAGETPDRPETMPGSRRFGYNSMELVA